MKKLFVLSVVLLIISFLGCQENQITEPVSGGQLSFSKKEVIDLCCPLNDPLSGQCFISGKIIYDLVASGLDPTNSLVELNIQLYAKLLDEAHVAGTPQWLIKSDRTETFIITETLNDFNLSKPDNPDKVVFKRLYNVENREDIVLEITYTLTVRTLNIKCMQIAPSVVVHNPVTSEY